MLAVILANTLALAVDHPDLSAPYPAVLRALNYAFTAAFVLELGLKVAGFGPRACLRDPWTVFDAVVIAAALAEIAVAETHGASLGGVSALRALRLLRVVKVVRAWRSMHRIVTAVLAALGAALRSVVGWPCGVFFCAPLTPATSS